MRNSAIVVVFIVGFALTTAHAAEPVTTCGQRVADGVLAADLDCSGTAGDAVQVDHSFSLGGFTLTVGVDFPDNSYGVHCVRHGDDADGVCEVSGPGTIAGSGAGPGNHGVRGRGMAVRNVTFTGNLSAVVGQRAKVNGCDINAVTGTGVWAQAARVNDTQITNSGRFGIGVGRRAILRHTDVTGSVLDGITSGGNVVLFASNVTGNAGNPNDCQAVLGYAQCSQSPQPWLCADISADRAVVLGAASTCGSSLVQAGSCSGFYDFRPGQSFGVCAGD